MKRYIGWLIREPEKGYKDNWRGVVNEPKSTFSSHKVEEVVEWFDAFAKTKVKMEETISTQLGYRVFVEE